ncbi:MAG TPA: hypothetical protein VMS56_07230 [Thermoanaerobaculia bacterium]|nr:hypothetical protein [Thermoanaerobaculia bacterium]
MKRILLAAAVATLLSSCASALHHEHDHDSHRYRACVERVVGGRILHDPGWVVEEHLDAMSGNRIYQFLSTYWNRIIEVTRVNRFCSMLSGGFDASSRHPTFATPLPMPRRP